MNDSIEAIVERSEPPGTEATTPTAPAEPDLIQRIPIKKIDLTSYNPRRTRDPVKFAELVGNIRVHGVLQPIMVRPNPEQADRFIIVAGERRTRAAAEVGLTEIPAVIRQLDDKTALALAVFENLHREDLHPIEEAEGYELLMNLHGWNAEEMGKHIGKSKAYVYARLKLTALCEEARKAFYAGQLDASVALLIARMPAPLQVPTLEKILSPDYSDDDGDPMTYRQAARFIQEECMVRLSGAPFKPGDETLVPEAGSCKDCPKRVANSPEVYQDVKHADVCTDPPCYESKMAAHAKRREEEARKCGQRVITGDEAKRLFPHGYLQSNKLVQIDENTSIEGVGYDKPSKVLKGDDQPETIIAIVDNKVVELWDRDEMRHKLEAAGKVKKDHAKIDNSSRPPSDHELRKIAALEERVRFEAWRACRDQLMADQVDADQNTVGVEVLRAIALETWTGHMQYERRENVVALWKGHLDEAATHQTGESDNNLTAFAYSDLLEERIAKMEFGELLLVLLDCTASSALSVSTWQDNKTDARQVGQLCKLAGINLEAIREEHRVAELEQKGKKRKKPKPVPPAAQVEEIAIPVADEDEGDAP